MKKGREEKALDKQEKIAELRKKARRGEEE